VNSWGCFGETLSGFDGEWGDSGWTCRDAVFRAVLSVSGPPEREGEIRMAKEGKCKSGAGHPRNMIHQSKRFVPGLWSVIKDIDFVGRSEAETP